MIHGLSFDVSLSQAGVGAGCNSQIFGRKSRDKGKEDLLKRAKQKSMRRLTSEQYAKIDARAQALPLSRRHAFLVILAEKIKLDAQVSRNQTISDYTLSSLIHAALLHSHQPQPGNPHADAAAKELDRLIRLHGSNN